MYIYHNEIRISRIRRVVRFGSPRGKNRKRREAKPRTLVRRVRAVKCRIGGGLINQRNRRVSVDPRAPDRRKRGRGKREVKAYVRGRSVHVLRTWFPRCGPFA